MNRYPTRIELVSAAFRQGSTLPETFAQALRPSTVTPERRRLHDEACRREWETTKELFLYFTCITPLLAVWQERTYSRADLAVLLWMAILGSITAFDVAAYSAHATDAVQSNDVGEWYYDFL